MADRKENLKSLFQNTRTRIIIVSTSFVLFIAVLVGIFHVLHMSDKTALNSSVRNAPSIRSIPGAQNPTQQYAKLQEQQNLDQASQAMKTGGSAIPTLIRSQNVNTNVQSVGANGEGSIGFSALSREEEAGKQQNTWLQSLKNANCSALVMKKVLSEGATLADVKKACSCAQIEKNGYSIVDLKNICSCQDLKKAGVSAATFRKNGYTAEALRACGFSACSLRAAGYRAAEMKKAGFTDGELRGAGYTAPEIAAVSGLPAGVTTQDVKEAGCSPESIAKLRKEGVSSAEIHKISGCSASQLLAGGFTPEDLKNAGFSAKDLKNAGLTAKALKALGFSPQDLKDAGFTPKELKDAGFSLKDLKDAGFTPKELKDAGFSLKDLKDAGFTPKALEDAGLLKQEAPLPNQHSGLPFPTYQKKLGSGVGDNNAQQLQDIMNRQAEQLADQKYQQAISQRTSAMASAANQSLQTWKKVPTQTYIAGTLVSQKKGAGQEGHQAVGDEKNRRAAMSGELSEKALIKTGDILFAVIDTAVNSDEPGPILATVVSGRFKGAKLIGSFTLPTNGDKMVISFNTMSVPGASKSTAINAYAIDSNTARTALASSVNHHYMLRYGSLFAASFLEGLGNAFQSADTTVTVGGTNGGGTVTVQNGINRSILQNAVIALGDVGQSWGEQTQQLFNTPVTVEVYSGTSVGVLFTQDLMSL